MMPGYMTVFEEQISNRDVLRYFFVEEIES